MDINNTPFYHINTKQPQTAGTAQESKASAETARSKEVPSAGSAQNNIPIELKEGQVLKGQVIDHRYNEVKIQLEPGKQVVTARLNGDVPLSIGQEARFQVTEETSDHLILRYLPEETASPNDAAIRKALTASNLPMTDRNKAIVSELLNHRMPIDKQTLQTLVKLSFQNREASPLTLVLMLKNKIPMTPENIRQFEAYQKGTNQLLNDIRTISQNISEVIGKFDSAEAVDNNELSSLRKEASVNIEQEASEAIIKPGTASTSAVINDVITAQPADKALSNSILNSSILSNSALSNSVLELNGKLIDLLLSRTNSSLEETPINQLLNKDELSQLAKAVNQSISSDTTDLPGGIPAELLSKLEDGSASLKDTAVLLAELYTDTSELSEALSPQELLKKLLSEAQTDQDMAQAITKLGNQLKLQEYGADTLLSELLKQPDRNALFQQLADDPDAAARKEQLLQGSVSVKEVLTLIQKFLSNTDMANAGKLLQAPEYSKLLQEAFLDKWTIKPEKITKKDAIPELYTQLKEDLDEITSFIKNDKAFSSSPQVEAPAKNLQENLQFMKDLNDAFTYLQLPVKLKEREAHADLYVMTRKKALRDNRENLSVLLHLNMTNLGSLNVHIRMKNKQIEADFYLENEEAVRLIKDNLPLLTDKLNDKGYNIKTSVKDQYKAPDFSRDFIEQNSPDHSIRQYTFDIRT